MLYISPSQITSKNESKLIYLVQILSQIHKTESITLMYPSISKRYHRWINTSF